MPSTSLLYRALVRSGVALAPALAGSRPKVKAGIAERRGVIARMAQWASAHRDLSRPLVWMHAASVGEGLQAETVLVLLRSAHPEWQVACTYFSPSAASLAPQLPADFVDCLPWDRRGDVDAALSALCPTAVVFSKLDLWPELATRAAARGVAVGIIGATVSPHARRLRWPARRLLRPGYRAVQAAGAISRPDAERLVTLGVPADRIELTGDPRFDSALSRARAIQADDPLLERLRNWAGERNEGLLVAGSTWPEDEEVLLLAFARVRESRPDARLVMVPHEPTTEHLTRLEASATHIGLGITRWSAGYGGPPLLVVDRVGILATLYAGADLAYVGGGYGRAGLHSVLEPAACGVPVLFGPRWQGSPDAGALLTQRAAAAVSPELPDWLDLDSGTTHAGKSPLAAIWLALLRHPAHRRAAGQRGLAYVESGAGAAARNASVVEALVRAASARG